MAQDNKEIWGHPRGLSLLFFTEMWERFSYYGMRAIFTLYMTNALLLSNKEASQIYGSYTGLVYLTPLLGGYVADRYWGNRRSIVLGGLLMAVGQFFLFGSATMYHNVGLAITLMWVGLVFLIVGNGFFKPNISSMIGQMYTEGDRRRDAAYTIFYMGINLGAFLAPLACGFVGDTGDPSDFKWGFLLAGIGMVLGTALFHTQKDKYVVTPDGLPIGASPNTAVSTNAEAGQGGLNGRQVALGVGLSVAMFAVFHWLVQFDMVASLIYGATIGMAVMIISDASLTKVERDRIIVLFVSAFFVVFFWSAFEQAGASLTFFADKQTNRDLFGWEVPASFFQSINAVAVVLLAPIIAAIWVWLAKRKSEPNSLLKQGLGLIILALGYVVIAMGVEGLGLDTKVSMFWLIALYVIHTIGELCLSPIGLSLVSKLSPMRFVSLLFGVWFLANAIANKAAGQLSELYPPAGREYATAMDNGISNDAYRGLLESNFTPTEAQHEKSDAVIEAFAASHEDMDLLAFVRKNKIGEIKIGTDKEGKPDTSYTYRLANVPESVIAVARAKGVEVQEITPGLAANLEKMGLKFDSPYYLGAATEGDDAGLFVTTKAKELGLLLSYPTFLGSKITNLYEFFMIFVGMAGVAGLILFGLSFPMRRMMHGAD